MAGKLEYLRDKSLSPADAVRQTLRSVEERLPKLKALSGDEVLALLADLDVVWLGLEEMEGSGLDVRPELARWRAIEGAVQRAASSLLRRLGGPAALARARPAPVPPPDGARWWWYLDELVGRQDRRRRRRLLAAGGILLGLLPGIVLLFQTVLRPDPRLVAQLQQRDAAVSALVAGDYAQALQAAEAGLALAPDDPDFLVLRGLALEGLDRPDEAEQSFAAAQRSVGPLAFRLTRGQFYFQAGFNQASLQDAILIVNLDPDSAEGWFLVGLNGQALGDRKLARAAYERAALLAQEQGNDALYVQARVNFATLSSLPP